MNASLGNWAARPVGRNGDVVIREVPEVNWSMYGEHVSIATPCSTCSTRPAACSSPIRMKFVPSSRIRLRRIRPRCSTAPSCAMPAPISAPPSTRWMKCIHPLSAAGPSWPHPGTRIRSFPSTSLSQPPTNRTIVKSIAPESIRETAFYKAKQRAAELPVKPIPEEKQPNRIQRVHFIQHGFSPRKRR